MYIDVEMISLKKKNFVIPSLIFIEYLYTLLNCITDPKCIDNPWLHVDDYPLKKSCVIVFQDHLFKITKLYNSSINYGHRLDR